MARPRPPAIRQRSMKVSRNGRTHHFYPASASQKNGRVRLDGHYRNPSGTYVRMSRFVTKTRASNLGFHTKDELAVAAANLVM